jgi:SAM-dependent methyltransferase
MTCDQSGVIVKFPRKFLSLLRCSRDGGELTIAEETKSEEFGVMNATLRCVACNSEYLVENGIARLMTSDVSAETQHEIDLRETEYDAMQGGFTPPQEGWRSDFMDAIEIPAHLDEMMPSEHCRAIELGCGDGRLAILMAQMGAEVLAVDFSYAALRQFARNLSLGIAPTNYNLNSDSLIPELAGRVGLVQADINSFYVAPSSFDRVLSATPCDSRDERMRMYRTIANALKDDGRYIASLEYDDLNRRLLGLPVLRRYTPGGVLIEHLSIAALRRELMPYFDRVSFRLVRAKLPFVRFLPKNAKIFVSLAATKIPVLKEFSEIVLARAERPVRLPREHDMRPGNSIVKGFFRWYKRKRGQQSAWEEGECV